MLFAVLQSCTTEVVHVFVTWVPEEEKDQLGVARIMVVGGRSPVAELLAKEF